MLDLVARNNIFVFAKKKKKFIEAVGTNFMCFFLKFLHIFQMERRKKVVGRTEYIE